MKNIILLLILQLAVLTWHSRAYAKCNPFTGKGCKINPDTIIKDLKQVDITNKNSRLRKELREFDQKRLDAMHPGAKLCMVNSLITDVRNFKHGGSRSLSRVQKYYLRQQFGNLVDKVTVVWNSDLNDRVTYKGTVLNKGSNAQTYGYYIYIAEKQKDNDTLQIILLAHELIHVKQYERYNKNLVRFCRKYMNQWLKTGFRYDNIPMEIEAYKEEYKFATWLKDNAYPRQYKKTTRYYHSNPNVMFRYIEFPKKLIIPKKKQPNKYALVCIKNETDIPIIYNYRWGNAQPVQIITPQGSINSHYWSYAYHNENRSPNFEVWFDFDTYQGGYQNKGYSMKKWNSKSNTCGEFNEINAFRRTGNGWLIDLFRIKK